MSHDWIRQVLRDLHDYALANNLPAIAAKAAETLLIAETELANCPEPEAFVAAPLRKRPH